MKLFFFKPDKYYPLLFIITKLSSEEEYNKLIELTSDIFHALLDNEEANDSNIIIFSIIKDYNKTTLNLILPSVKSNKTLVEKCHSNTQFLNLLVIEVLNNKDTEFYFEFSNNKLLLHPIKMNLMGLSKYYK